MGKAKKKKPSITLHSAARQVASTPEITAPKMNPALLRLLVIFPNVLSYILLFGVIVYIMTNFSELQAAGALTFWVILSLVFAPMALFTTYSIVKRIRAGVM
ncbi:acyl-phosphate glycerol 3-phosphate acyltransferase [Lysinibacillus sp. LZ02]|uniref:acyl-phosphate glycerol 3-phosphate acyltransferase n=1 Tax=Lysinibacillus sp. LZ02 TaxID=3420668 RepID=UPI003D368804